MTRPRGRPREYDPEEALEAAMTVFWERGFAATSLTHLCEATGMNRPSLYAAFGDKRSIYLRTLGRFMQRMAESVRELLRSEPDLERALTGFYLRAIDLYVSEGPGHLGCMVTSTASLESARDSEVRALLEETVHRLDKALTERFRQAGSNDAPPLSNAESRGPLATAILHSLSIRARAGQSRRELREFARASVALLIR